MCISFGDLLRYLMNITDTKAVHLSISINYDASYISKWINYKLLPSRGEVDKLIDSLAEYFCDKITLMGVEEKFEQIISKKIMLDKVLLKSALKNKLYSSYYYSADIKLLDFQKNRYIISEPKEILYETRKYISNQIILNNDNRLDIYMCVNIMEMFYNGSVNSFIYYTENKSSIHLNIMFKKLDFRYFNEKKSNYISIISSLMLYNTNIYYEGDLYTDDFIYFVDKGLLNYKFDSESNPYILNELHSPLVLSKMKNTCEAQFSREHLFFESVNDSSYEDKFLCTSIESNEPIYLLTSFYSWHFIDNCILDRIIDHGVISDNILEIVREKVEKTYEILEKGIEVNIIVDFDNLFQFGGTNTVNFFGITIEVSLEDHISYCSFFSELMKKYSNLKIFSLSSFEDFSEINAHGINILVNKDMFLVKKNKLICHELDDLYGVVKNDNLNDVIYDSIKKEISEKSYAQMGPEKFLKNCLMYVS